MTFLFEECPGIIDDAIDEQSDDAFIRLIKKLKVSPHPVSLSCKETAGIMMGKCDMSQRSYKVLKGILQKNNVRIPAYDKLRAFCKSIDVGPIKPIHEENIETDCSCMGYCCHVGDTLQRILLCETLCEKLEFIPTEKQRDISDFLKEKNSDLYSNFDINKRTFLIRDTGDNFRAASRYTTEQTSLSILNIRGVSIDPLC